MLQGRDEKVAIIADNININYHELRQNVAKFSCLFDDLKSERIVIFSENRMEWIYTFYAAWRNGCIPVPIDHMSGIDDTAFIINDCKPELIFCSKDKQKVLSNALKEVNYEPRVLVFDDIDLTKINTLEEPGNINYSLNDTAVIIYTSGTTGSPKGVMLSFENLIVNIDSVSKHVRIILPSDRILLLLPLHHIFPLIGTLIMPLYLGSTIAICPSLNAVDIMRTLQKNKVTIIIGVPRLFGLIRKGIIDKINQSKAARILFGYAKKINSLAISRILFKKVHTQFGGAVRHLISGGAALEPEVGVDYKALGFDILEGYGMTEASPIIAFTRPGKFIPGSPGLPIPGMQVEIRDGEIVARGKNVMQGYYCREKETNEIVKDNWLYTGDLGYIDKKGRLYITGRKKEIIVLSTGKNINPIEIEHKILKSTAIIKECGVFLLGEKLNILIVPDSEHIAKENIEDTSSYIRTEIIKKYNEKATVSKRLLKVHFTDIELPRTRLGKLQRFKLMELAAGVKKDDSSLSVQDSNLSKELQTILGFLKEQTGDSFLPDDYHGKVLAVNSLYKVTFALYIENTFGIQISEDDLFNFKSIRELSEYIINQKPNSSLTNWNVILKERINLNLPKVGFSFNVFNLSLKTILKTLYNIKAEGRNNLPEGPCIIAPNRQSNIDGFFMASLLKRKFLKKTYFSSKEIHWKKRWLKFIARKNNVILMDPNKELSQTIQKMAEILRKGKNLIIFPENLRVGNTEQSELKKMFAILASELNVPVIPVAISGAQNVLPSGAWFPRPFKKVSFKFLQPVYPSNYSYDKLSQIVLSKFNKRT